MKDNFALLAETGYHNRRVGIASASLAAMPHLFRGACPVTDQSEVERGYNKVANRAASTISEPLIVPPAFLSLPYWTVDEVSEYFRCEAQTIRKAISQTGTFHGLKPCRFGRRWYFKAADARAAMEA
jgi:hypothetical protein